MKAFEKNWLFKIWKISELSNRITADSLKNGVLLHQYFKDCTCYNKRKESGTYSNSAGVNYSRYQLGIMLISLRQTYLLDT